MLLGLTAFVPLSNAAIVWTSLTRQHNTSSSVEHGVAAAASLAKTQHNASSNASSNASYPCPPVRTDAAVGQVFSLYYSDGCGEQVSLVQALDSYEPASRPEYVWHGATLLPKPSCALQLRSQSNYPQPNRKANLRLAELAVCELFGSALPSCGATDNQVCELMIKAPIPSSDDLQEPTVGAAIALVAYSQLCAMSQNSTYEHYKCQIHGSEQAVCAGLQLQGGHVHFKGLETPGLLDLKLHDAYMLRLKDVTLAAESSDQYTKTEDYKNRPDVLSWSHYPPKIDFCQDLSCLVNKFIR